MADCRTSSNFFVFSCLLYPACNRVDRESLLLRHSAPQFRRHCVSKGGTQHRGSPRRQSEEMKIFNILFSRVGTEPTLYCAYKYTLEQTTLNIHYSTYNM